MKLNIIVPVHNEEGCVARTIQEIKNILKIDHDIIVVDDYSTDGSVEAIKELQNKIKHLRLITNIYGRGFAGALKTGFSYVTEGTVVPVMADLSDEIETVEKMYRKIMEGYGIACGARYNKIDKGIFNLKEIISRIAGLFMYFFVGVPTTDITNSFKMYRKQILDKINIESKSFEISMEITLKAYFAGYRITQIPTIKKRRILEKSKFHILKDGKNYLRWIMFGLKKFIRK